MSMHHLNRNWNISTKSSNVKKWTFSHNFCTTTVAVPHLGPAWNYFDRLQHHQFSLNFRYQLLAAQGNLLFTRRKKQVLRTNHYPPTYMFIPIHKPSRKYSGKGSFTLTKCERESEFYFDVCHCSLSALNWIVLCHFRLCSQCKHTLTVNSKNLSSDFYDDNKVFHHLSQLWNKLLNVPKLSLSKYLTHILWL